MWITSRAGDTWPAVATGIIWIDPDSDVIIGRIRGVPQMGGGGGGGWHTAMSVVVVRGEGRSAEGG